jgi:phage I-like protein
MLKKKLPLLLGGFLAVLVVVGAIGAGIAYADNSTPPAAISGQTFDGRGPRGGHMLGSAELEAAAKALGMTTDELSTALKSGQTLEQVATAKGVDFQKVQDAVNAAHREEMRTQIKQALSDGTITQAKADWLLEGLDKGYLDQPGFGLGFGRGGPGGPDMHGNGQQPPAAPSTPAASQ